MFAREWNEIDWNIEEKQTKPSSQWTRTKFLAPQLAITLRKKKMFCMNRTRPIWVTPIWRRMDDDSIYSRYLSLTSYDDHRQWTFISSFFSFRFIVLWLSPTQWALRGQTQFIWQTFRSERSSDKITEI